MNECGHSRKCWAGRANDGGSEEFKINVAEVLTQHASAIPLDPEWGLPPAEGAGLLLTYEKTRYDKILPGHLPDLGRRLLFQEVSY